MEGRSWPAQVYRITVVTGNHSGSSCSDVGDDARDSDSDEML